MLALPSPLFDSLSGSAFGRKSPWHTRHLTRSGKTIMKDPSLLAPYRSAYMALPRRQRDHLTLRQFIYRHLLNL